MENIKSVGGPIEYSGAIMADIGLAILLTWHVTSVIVWLGSSFAFAFVVYPALELSDQKEGSILFYRSFLRAFAKIVGGASISAIVAGIFVFGFVSSVDVSRMPAGWNLIFISIGAVLGLVGIILTLGVIYPMIGKVIIALPSENNNVSEGRYQLGLNTMRDVEDKFRAVSSVCRFLVVLLLIVVTLMTLGIYF